MPPITPVFSEISEEALLLHKKILVAAEENLEIKSLYKGCQLIFSPLIHKPKILLLGFNPGGGYFKYQGLIAENFEHMKELRAAGPASAKISRRLKSYYRNLRIIYN